MGLRFRLGPMKELLYLRSYNSIMIENFEWNSIARFYQCYALQGNYEVIVSSA